MKSSSPEGGACPPPDGGYPHSLPLPPRGRGRRPEAGRGRGVTGKYYLVVLAGRGAVVDVCPTLQEANRSCRQYQRLAGGTYLVSTADAVGEKWK